VKARWSSEDDHAGATPPRIGQSLRSKPLAKAAQWYNQRQPGLGEKFIREVDRAIARVLENPLAFPVILRRHEVRRVLTKRFPYRIFFSLKGEVVVVHVGLHGRRDDRHWKDRL
jgi:toxin ParE1/3/4